MAGAVEGERQLQEADSHLHTAADIHPVAATEEGIGEEAGDTRLIRFFEISGLA